ncbi:MAG: HEAT repeat domain-containing protein [Polyangiaceae bacterium]|nr:HEAT repeat domain-containing protein [Polyangiaceae bacterium]
MSYQIGPYEKVRALAANARLLAVGGTRAPLGGARGAASPSQVTIYDHIANKPARSITVPAHVAGLAFAVDRLAAACSDGMVRILDPGAGTIMRSIEAHPGGATAVAASPGGDRLASVGADGSLKLWKTDGGAPIAAWSLSTAPLRAVAFDPAGEMVAAAGDDGVVRVITLSTGLGAEGAGGDPEPRMSIKAQRDMAGHDGPVLALAFTPRDGRLASAGEDGTVRIWYLVGEVEHEARGEGGTGHAGAVTALLFLPTPAASEDGKEAGDRLLSAGTDGKIRVWRLEDRRKPKTLETSAPALHALALGSEGTGAVFAGGERRTVWRFALDAAGTPADRGAELDHGLSALSQGLGGARPARETAVKALAALDEPEALELAIKALRSDREPEVRALAASELGAKGRRDARPKLREALDDSHAPVRMAAFAALRALDPDAPLSPLRAALAARSADVRCKALSGLAALHGTSPLIPGLIADKLADGEAEVRLTALAELSRIYPGNPEPLRMAFERGPADLRGEALMQATLAGWLSAPALAPIVARALDDADAAVRRVAFAGKVLERRALAHALEARDEDLARTVRDISRRLAQIRQGLLAAPEDRAGGKGGKAAPAKVSDEAIAAARAAIPGVGEPGAAPGEADLEPLLTAMACRTPDTAVRGARGLAQLGDTRALGALLQLTREPDAGLRRQAATALQELRDARAEKRLVWMLDDADATVRAAALDAFAKLAEAAPLAIAEAALRSSHEDIRIRGLDRLVKLAEKGERTPEAEALLADAIEDESAKVRGEAFRTLWSWHAKDPQKALDRALDARFPDLRLRAVEELKAQAQHAWALERLQATVGDRDASVAQAAYDAVVKIRGKEAPEAHLAAVASVHASVRASGARGAASVSDPEPLRSPLMKLLEDQHEPPRTAALESLDRLLPNEGGPVHVGLQASFLDLRVRAAELCAVRRDERLIDPMRALLADRSLFKEMPIQVLGPLRQRAATSLATRGSPRLVKYFATELLKDEHPEVREQAARGLAMAARRGDEGYLLDAMGHADVAVRSWAADGLSRLGDVRALPVLTGTLRHEHPPIRVATIMSFAALGPEGYGGMLQGLEDPSREVQEIVFAIVLARDLRAFRRAEPPDLLTSALSSQRSDVRFAAARALELRTDPEAYMAHLIEVLTPPKPGGDRERGSPTSVEKAADMKHWPPEHERGRILVGLAEALAGDNPEQRYAAAQALRLRRKPLEYFREARRVGQLRPAGAPYVADTTPRGPEETDTTPPKGWLRRLFAGGKHEEAPPPPQATTAGQVGGFIRKLFTQGSGPEAAKAAKAAPADAAPGERERLRWLAFGAYMGLLRQVAPGDDEGHRVRRDAIDRIVELCAGGHVSATAAVPPLVRALDDPHHLVRKAAFTGVKALFPEGSDEPLSLGLASSSADVARAALDELAARGEAARPRIVRALDSGLPEVRRYAFEILERMSPKGSLDPLLAALGSQHADLRLGVLERLTTSSDPRVVPALCRAMESDHDDLRLRAAELLARRRDDRAVDVLATFLRADQAASVTRARDALVALASAAAVRALAARIEEAAPADRAALARALGATRSPDALDPLAARFEDEAAEVRTAALQASLEIAGRDRDKRDAALAIRALGPAARAKDPALRLAAARELDAGDDPAANDLLVPLFSDRDAPTRAAAVSAYSKRVIDKGAPVAPLEAVLRAGARDLMLAAAEGVASRGLGAALRPLLLFVRAGEPGERERALLALGTLGDPRAAEELEAVAGGGTKEAPVEQSMQAAATEALGRLAAKLGPGDGGELRRRLAARVEASLDADALDIREAATRGARWIGGERGRVLLEGLVRGDGTPERVRAVAAHELGKLGDKAAEPALAKALSHWNSDVRKAARKALEALFPGERLRVELLAVESPHDDIAEPAATYLAQEASPAELLPRLGTIRDEALRKRLSMGLLQRPSLPAEGLAKLLEDDRPHARKDAAWLIAARTGSSEGAMASSTSGAPGRAPSAPSAPDPGADRAALAKALAAAERRTADRWARAHGRDRAAEAAAWRELVWAARRAGAAEAAPALRAVVRGGDKAAPPDVRREAARALGALRASAAEDADALTAALRDMDPGVRAAAAAALGAIAPDRAARAAAAIAPFDPVAFGATARAASAAARAELTALEPGRRLALPAMIAAGEVEPLLALARSAIDGAAQLDAIAALGRAGGDSALALLSSLAFDKKANDLAVRKAAYRAYRRAKRRAARVARQNGAHA